MLLHILPEDEIGYSGLPVYTSPFTSVLQEEHNFELHQQELAQYKQQGLDFLRTLTQKAVEAGVETEYSQLTGNPGRMICELADTRSADLILVGSRGLKGLKEMFLGSVSNYVTHHAPCSVLIVRAAMAQQLTINNNQNQIIMFEKIFTLNTKVEQTNTLRLRKGVIIGAGQVGLACAYSLLIQNCFDELVLQDID